MRLSTVLFWMAIIFFMGSLAENGPAFKVICTATSILCIYACLTEEDDQP